MYGGVAATILLHNNIVGQGRQGVFPSATLAAGRWRHYTYGITPAAGNGACGCPGGRTAHLSIQHGDNAMRHSMKSIIAAAVMFVPAAAGAQTVTEPSSGVAFPVELEVPGGGRHVLTGTGLRTRTVLKVKVYAFGIYMDPAGARSQLAAFAGRDARSLAGDAKFYDAVLAMNVPLSLRLVMTRNVAGEDMAEAFDGALRPRVQHAAGRGLAGGEAALGTFRGLFSLDRLTKGAVLDFTCEPDGTLQTTVGGEQKPAIQSKALCWALFDVYLGPKPITADGKRSAIARVPGIIGS